MRRVPGTPNSRPRDWLPMGHQNHHPPKDRAARATISESRTSLFLHVVGIWVRLCCVAPSKTGTAGYPKKVSMTEMPPCAPPVVFLHPKNMIQKQLYNSFTSHHKAIMSLPAPWRTSGPPAVPWHFPSPPSHVGEPSSGPSYTAPAAPRGQPSHARPRPAGNRGRGPSTARRTGSRWRRRRRVFAGARLVEMVRGCGHRILVRAP